MTSTARSSRASANVLLALLGIGLLASMPAAAKKSDREQAANVTSKSFDGSQQPNGIQIFTTNVVMTQGTLKVTGSKATVYTDADNSITRVVIDGNPATIHQLDDTDQPMDGHANNIDYKPGTDATKTAPATSGVAILTGNASVKQPNKGDAAGDKLTYNTDDSTMKGESNGEGVVVMNFQPKPKPGAAPAKPAATPATPATPPKKP
ncbi:lipopolysaccharide export system protein LptA [Luteibacter rhizovicinus]|uniref:Lipopolysaccharide export system protein LptA n=1 Tax=Luteibacter rhizovicinus TaxID=242606 RepID=A0A4R3YP03_9GAMM|nr:lipopolysaccharide transport periplasmic protein LptA [Luteibacter rhizovicinus]TCV94080.1 lipopolysaccharide export system protein LptA [Luteibacter rhizovicinus]